MIAKNRTPRSSIRLSKSNDLNAINNWLIEEKNQGIDGNFLCNWSIIEDAHRNKELLVYIDGKTKLPVAFQTGGLIRPGIIQVRYAYRKIGIGRKLVQRCIASALKKNQCLLYIQCKPSTSIQFWQRMGFTLIEGKNELNYAYQIIDKQLQLPEQGKAVKIVIRFFPESIKWNSDTKPLIVFSPSAKQISNGVVYLAERVQYHEMAFLQTDRGDVVVEIELEGNSRYFDKAKYACEDKIGVIRCTNGYYIDIVLLPS